MASAPQPNFHHSAPKMPNLRVGASPLTRMLPTLVVVGAVSTVALYVKAQLHDSNQTYNRMFAQQNTPEVEESRRKALLVETYGDPRRSLFNVLGW
ncbi:hypothetical protein BJ170DRAFT_615440 [Xylariales sp. AK1849]|nr:hypothetical protein BJ170DRAFT_615440 [Xylariales sp. AK1849]